MEEEEEGQQSDEETIEYDIEVITSSSSASIGPPDDDGPDAEKKRAHEQEHRHAHSSNDDADDDGEREGGTKKVQRLVGPGAEGNGAAEEGAGQPEQLGGREVDDGARCESDKKSQEQGEGAERESAHEFKRELLIEASASGVSSPQPCARPSTQSQSPQLQGLIDERQEHSNVQLRAGPESGGGAQRAATSVQQCAQSRLAAARADGENNLADEETRAKIPAQDMPKELQDEPLPTVERADAQAAASASSAGDDTGAQNMTDHDLTGQGAGARERSPPGGDSGGRPEQPLAPSPLEPARLLSERLECPTGWLASGEPARVEPVARQAPIVALAPARVPQSAVVVVAAPAEGECERMQLDPPATLLATAAQVRKEPAEQEEEEQQESQSPLAEHLEPESAPARMTGISVRLDEAPDAARAAEDEADEAGLAGAECASADSDSQHSAAGGAGWTLGQHPAYYELHHQRRLSSSSAHLLNWCAPDPDENLEREFDEEPEFEARDVQVKRNRDPRDEYRLGAELGRGKFGTVYRCVEASSGRALAAKFIHMRRREDREDVEREVAIMSVLQHKRLLQLYDAFDDGRQEMCLITELVEGGELFERIVDDDFDLTEKKAAVFMRQICEGVEYMHGQQIVHLDMKPENILCLSRTGMRIKLIDFGLARKLDPAKPIRVMFGTPDFAAPEVLGYELVSLATDMWSVGVICYVLLSGLSPFMGDNDMETMANVMRATFDFNDPAFDAISELAKDFISRLLVRDAPGRLKPGECLRHAWLARGGGPLEAAIRSRRESAAVMISAHHRLALEQAAAVVAAVAAAASVAAHEPQADQPLTGPQTLARASISGTHPFASASASRASFGTESSASSAGAYSLDKRRLKRYVVRRKWHKTVHAIMALGRMGANLRLAG